MGSRATQQDSMVSARSLTRMISIPLPRPSSGSKTKPAQAVQEELPIIDNLMSFDEMEEAEINIAQTDIFANLASLEPGLSRPHTNGMASSHLCFDEL